MVRISHYKTCKNFYRISTSLVPFVTTVLGWLFLPCALSFSLASSRAVSPRRLSIGMVRNIDFPEALIFHEPLNVDDGNSILLQDDGITLKTGLLGLLKECRDVGTPAILISWNDHGPPSQVKDYLRVFSAAHDNDMTVARALWESIHAITIQPAGFGGSAGFGRKMADPERSPLPKHTVVFCADEAVCRAARAIGMRVLCLHDNDLADAIIADYDNLCLEDVATPGSFWLNPPYPRDDQGNKVDVETTISMKNDEEDTTSGENPGKKIEHGRNEGELSDGYLQAILDDLDPL